MGRDIYWPPSARERGFTVESVVGPRGLRPRPGGSNRGGGMRGGPLVGDKWSEWMQAYYGGRNVSRHRNIVWSNGARDARLRAGVRRGSIRRGRVVDP